jgi:hypothetical protein
MKRHYRFLLKIIAGAGLSLLSAQDPFVLDTSLTNVLPKSLTNSPISGNASSSWLKPSCGLVIRLKSGNYSRYFAGQNTFDRFGAL